MSSFIWFLFFWLCTVHHNAFIVSLPTACHLHKFVAYYNIWNVIFFYSINYECKRLSATEFHWHVELKEEGEEIRSSSWLEGHLCPSFYQLRVGLGFFLYSKLKLYLHRPYWRPGNIPWALQLGHSSCWTVREVPGAVWPGIAGTSCNDLQAQPRDWQGPEPFLPGSFHVATLPWRLRVLHGLNMGCSVPYGLGMFNLLLMGAGWRVVGCELGVES